MISRQVLEAFDTHLADHGLSFQAVIIGGAALILMGIIERATQDVDCLDPHIPEEIKTASIVFAKTVDLKAGWFNNGPESLKRDLPPGWETQIQPLFQGQCLRLFTLGRLDLLRSKLYAFCDRQQDRDDCVALRPTVDELRQVYPWLLERDANPMWPEHVASSLRLLARELEYEFQP